MFIYIHVQHRRKEYSEKLFQSALLVVSLLLIVESVSWAFGETGNSSQIPVHYLSNAIYLSVIPLPGCVALTYLDYKIYGDKKSNKRKLYTFYLIPTYLSVISGVCNVFKPGYLFYIDAQNKYHRGFYVYASAYIMYIFILLVSILFYKDKKKMSARVFKAVGLYFIVPIAGIVLQIKLYGTSFAMPSHTIGLLIVFLLLERDEMMGDSLTGLYTRHNFEMRLRDKLKRAESFHLILVDLDDFKCINDTYGHIEGDKVLQIVSEILIDCTNVEDLVCRYGGDEFSMLIEHRYELSQVTKQIKAQLDKHNNCNDRYNISLSYGQLFVREDNTMTMEQLIEEVDNRMYLEKKTRRCNNSTNVL